MPPTNHTHFLCHGLPNSQRTISAGAMAGHYPYYSPPNVMQSPYRQSTPSTITKCEWPGFHSMECFEADFYHGKYCVQHGCEQPDCMYPKKLVSTVQPGVPNLSTVRYCDFHTCEVRSCTEGVVSYMSNGMSAWSPYCSRRKLDTVSFHSNALSPFD
ncbi:hypothetical protein AOQ84DRAFT_387105 [Glonium stellatum]|uniref:Uncharacterized protein n=1 Tax=Glonium stellatum TaxID=574774 RepID=A0A8E2JVU6_9PEZI|nr:hypothetical protein AOQ84DRAFT_387105 [Glonium stellatum]